MTATLHVINEESDHFLLTFDGPGRVEVALVGGNKPERRIIAHVYEGADVDPEQEVLFAYDGMEGGNEDVSA